MATGPSASASFEIAHQTEPPATLLAGFSTFGLAGLTAVDYLVDQLEMERIGYVQTEALPPITPFEDGRPRHHTQLYSAADLEIAVLVNEMFVPLWAAEPFAQSILDWTDETGVEEVCVVTGVPVTHGPDDHRVFYVATEDFRASRLDAIDLPAMGNGFLDGVNSSLLARGMDTPLRTGVLVTPVHAQAPDVEAAIRLVDAVETVYGLEVDTGALEQFAADVRQYYGELAERLEAVDKQHVPEDRMYM